MRCLADHSTNISVSLFQNLPCLILTKDENFFNLKYYVEIYEAIFILTILIFYIL